jgi:hypothetical protein
VFRCSPLQHPIITGLVQLARLFHIDFEAVALDITQQMHSPELKAGGILW